jgi:virginiamycin B lyase
VPAIQERANRTDHPGGRHHRFSIPTPDSGPRALSAGADGNVWFSEFKTAKIGRITPQGKITEFPLPRPDIGPGVVTEFSIPTPHSGPINIAVGPDKNIWFTGRDKLGRVTPDGSITQFPLAPNTRPTGLSAGSDHRPLELRQVPIKLGS